MVMWRFSVLLAPFLLCLSLHLIAFPGNATARLNPKGIDEISEMSSAVKDEALTSSARNLRTSHDRSKTLTRERSRQRRKRSIAGSISYQANANSSDVVFRAQSQSFARTELRAHIKVPTLHPMFVCTNPEQLEVAEGDPTKCRSLWPESPPLKASETWAGGNLLRCMGKMKVPDCIVQVTMCPPGVVEPPPPRPCHFPFEYNGNMHSQCYKEPRLLGLKWRGSGVAEPTEGRLLTNLNLSTSLTTQTEFTQAEWTAFAINDLRENDYVKSGDTFFTPDPEDEPAFCLDRPKYDEDALKWPCHCDTKGYWNAPPAGGSMLTIVGAGFGSLEKECDQQYLDCLQGIIIKNDPIELSNMDRLCIERLDLPGYGPDSNYYPEKYGLSTWNQVKDYFPQACRNLRVKVGYTQVERANVAWTSDSSISAIVPPGIGTSLDLQVIAGRFGYDQNVFRKGMLDALFSYNSPMEAAVVDSNAATTGGAVVTVLGRHFGTSEVCVAVRLGNTMCLASSWLSATSIICAVPPGTGSGHSARVQLMQCPPAIQGMDPALAEQEKCRFNSEYGLSRAFSYDTPAVLRVLPNNAPPSGFVVLTLSGMNFGTFLDDPWRVTRIDPTTAGLVAEEQKFLHVADGVQAYSLAKYPTRDYYKSLHLRESNKDRAADFAGGLEYVCVSASVDEFDGRACSCISTPECNHPACGPVRADFNCRSARYLCVEDTPRSYRECGNLAGSNNCRSIKGYPDGTCQPVSIGMGCQYYEESCRPSSIHHNPDECVPDYLHAACSIPLEPDGISCRGVPRYSEAEALCTSRQHATISGTECITLTWLSDSSMICRVGPGLGRDQTAYVEINGQGRSLSRAFSYDAPVIHSIPKILVPATGGTTLSILGQGFGIFPCNRTWCSVGSVRGDTVSQKGMAGVSMCLKTLWNSDSSVNCVIAPGLGTGALISLTILGSNSSFLETYLQEGNGRVDYQPPMVSNVTPTNAPAASVGKDILIQGTDFGVYDSTVKSFVVGTACITSSWTSDSSIRCIVSHGLGSPPCGEYATERACYDSRCNSEDAFEDTSCRVVRVEIGGQRGSLVGLFSFDVPEVRKLYPTNAPATGKVKILLLGSNFGMHASYKHKGVIGIRSCDNSTWSSDSSLVCEVAAFTGEGYRMGVKVLPNPSDESNYLLHSLTFRSPMLSYDRPTITAFAPPNAPSTADIKITAIGQNFGTAVCGGDCKEFAEPELTLGDTKCLTTDWIADSSMICAIASYPLDGSGVGQELPSSVVVGKQNNELDTISFCFDSPLVSGFTTGNPGNNDVRPYSKNGPAEGGQQLTIFGANFGMLDYSPRVSIGDSTCRAKTWTSDTSIFCTTMKATRFLAGANQELTVRVEVGLEHRPTSFQKGEFTEAYFYDPVIIKPFQITNEEINFLAFVAALLLSGCCITWFNRRYTSSWSKKIPSLALVRAKDPMGKRKAKETQRWPASMKSGGHRHHKLGTTDDDESVAGYSTSSSEENEFYDRQHDEDGTNRSQALQKAFVDGMAAGKVFLQKDIDDRQEQGEKVPMMLHTNKLYLPHRGINAGKARLTGGNRSFGNEGGGVSDELTKFAEERGLSRMEAVAEAARERDLHDTEEAVHERFDPVQALHAMGPDGVPIGWSELCPHIGDVPESVASPGAMGSGVPGTGGGRLSHYDLILRSRGKERIVTHYGEKARGEGPAPSPLERTKGEDTQGTESSERRNQFGMVSGDSSRYGPISSRNSKVTNSEGTRGQNPSERFGPVSQRISEDESTGPDDLDAVVIEHFEDSPDEISP